MTSSRTAKDGSEEAKRSLSFSIERILNGDRKVKEDAGSSGLPVASLPWLHCTRYCPPKVPRRKEPPQKRQLGRHPRIPFTAQQLAVLEERFRRGPYLSSQEVKEVAKELDLADIRVKIWFQNRRARERREQSTKQMPRQIEIPIIQPVPSQIIPRTHTRSPTPFLANGNTEIKYRTNNNMRFPKEISIKCEPSVYTPAKSPLNL